MKYETPELTALTPAINAIQGATSKNTGPVDQIYFEPEGGAAYQDWE
jgi:hypothetical protein